MERMMEPEIADEYDRLMDALQEAADEDPQSDLTKSLRQQIVVLLREHFGSATEPSLIGRTVH